MTRDEAKLIIEAFNVDSLLKDKEEVGCLKESNPELLAAYKALIKHARSVPKKPCEHVFEHGFDTVVTCEKCKKAFPFSNKIPPLGD